MIFNSLTFIFLFLPIVIVLCFMVELCFKKSNKRVWLENIILFISSIVFFAWSDVKQIKVLTFLIIMNYLVGLLEKKSKKYMLLGVLCNLSVLIYFKYIGLFIETINEVFKGRVNSLEIIVPVGISFIIFHCISYMMDLYNGDTEPCKNIINFALYIVFFPKLVQGPIVKYKDMKKEIENRKIVFDEVVYGIERFIIGLSKKVLIADVLGISVDEIYNLLPSGLDVGTAWIGTIFFSFQIYFDFSGYSDMAIGMSNMLGFHFHENFNFPYLSRSISEFWRRWHISLGAWFREYLYFPLGGNRSGNVYINLFIVFLATGVWHGAAWIYLLWGGVHGICVVLERYLSKKEIYQKIPKIIKWFIAMFIVNIGWICFKVNDVNQFLQYVMYMFGIGKKGNYSTFSYEYFLTQRNVYIIVFCCIGIFLMGNGKIKEKIDKYIKQNTVVCLLKYILLCIIMFVCYTAIVSGTYSPFLYFQY